MAKVAIVTDTNCCFTIDEARELGIYMIPMPFIINEEIYYEGVTMSDEEFYKNLVGDVTIKTSQPSPSAIMEVWDEALKEADELVHIPMSSSLSGTYQTSMMLAKEYNGKVQIADLRRIAITMKESVYDGLKLAEQGCNALEIKEKLEADSKNATIYLTIENLKYLKRGGRLTPVAAALGTLLKIKPILTIQDSAIDSFAKARTLAQAKSIMLKATLDDVEARLGGKGRDNKLSIAIVHNGCNETAEEYRKVVQDAFPEQEIFIDKLSLSIAAHTGPGVIAIACIQKNI